MRAKYWLDRMMSAYLRAGARIPLLRKNCAGGARFRTAYRPYAEDLEYPDEKKIAVETPHPMMNSKFAIDATYFSDNFSRNSSSSLYEVPEGCYTELNESEIRKHFPEGLAGESKEEFEFTGKNAWMVRESSKLLCGILDDFHPPVKASNSSSSSSRNTIETRINIPGLTDRNELQGSTSSLKYYGNELIERTLVNKSSVDASLKVITGNNSHTEKCIESIKGAVAGAAALSTAASSTSIPTSIPNKILITGTRGSGKSITLNQLVLHARKNGWLVMFIPDGWNHVQSGPFIEPAIGYHHLPSIPVDDMTETTKRPVFDNSFLSVQALRGFWRANR